MTEQKQNQQGTTADPEGITDAYPAPPEPSEALRALDRLVGTWTVTGGAPGTVTYEWMEGGYFLIQRVELEQFGQTIRGFEVIGNLRPFGEEASEHVHSRFYDSAGNAFDYVYEIDGETLWIWALEKGHPAHFKGTFDASGDVVDGEWVYPGAGGYPSTMTRIVST